MQIQVEMQVSNLLLTAQIRHNLPGSGIWPDELWDRWFHGDSRSFQMLTRGLWIEHGKLNDSDRNPFVSLSGLEQVFDNR